jgi:hypothetical protein
METLVLYFGKMILCSGVMFGYYFVFLKDKTFHHYNRFYLLSILFLSIFLPLIKIDYFTIEVNPDLFLLLKNLKTVQPQNFAQNDFNIYPFLFSAVGLVSVFFILKFLFGLIKIQRLKTRFPKTEFEGIKFYETPLEDAPFSFFRNLFWKNSIELQSDLGRQILKHEMVHIEQKHTWDKIIMTTVNSIFWFNPVFYLIKKEIFLIHEYLADKKAVKQSDTKAFAQMLLASHFTGTSLPATSPFLSSNLKKRITMLKKSHTKFSYLRKISALPIIFFLAFAYLVNAKNREIKQTNEVIAKAVSVIKKDTIKTEVNSNLVEVKDGSDITNLILGENFAKSSDKDIFTVLGKKVSKQEFLLFCKSHNLTSKYVYGFYDKHINNLPNQFSIDDVSKFPKIKKAIDYVNSPEFEKQVSTEKKDTLKKYDKFFQKNIKPKYTVTSSFSKNFSDNLMKKELENSNSSDSFKIDDQKVSKSVFEDYFNKNFGNPKLFFVFGNAGMETATPIKFFYSKKTEDLIQKNAELKAKVLEQRNRAENSAENAKFQSEAAKLKAESADLTKTVATEKPNSNSNPKQNDPWNVSVKAYPKSIFEDKDVKYYIDGKLVEGSKWKEILPKNIKAINIVKIPGQKEGGIIYIVTKDSPLVNIPTQFDKIYINGKMATQNELFKISKDSIKTQNINKNTENGKSFNEIRVTTK